MNLNNWKKIICVLYVLSKTYILQAQQSESHVQLEALENVYQSNYNRDEAAKKILDFLLNDQDSVCPLNYTLFETASSEIKRKNRWELNNVISVMIAFPNLHFSIEGHTDGIGGIIADQILSEERAELVYNILVDGGINPNRLIHFGHGKTKPRAPNNTKEGRALNRRVEIIIHKQK